MFRFERDVEFSVKLKFVDFPPRWWRPLPE